MQYRVRNWSKAALNEWLVTTPTGRRGASPTYSDRGEDNVPKCWPIGVLISMVQFGYKGDMLPVRLPIAKGGVVYSGRATLRRD